MFDKPTLLENRKYFLSDLSRILVNGFILFFSFIKQYYIIMFFS